MFGYATDETEECMPLTVVLAHKLNEKIAELRRSGDLRWARPDSKTQVRISFQYKTYIDFLKWMRRLMHNDQNYQRLFFSRSVIYAPFLSTDALTTVVRSLRSKFGLIASTVHCTSFVGIIVDLYRRKLLLVCSMWKCIATMGFSPKKSRSFR